MALPVMAIKSNDHCGWITVTSDCAVGRQLGTLWPCQMATFFNGIRKLRKCPYKTTASYLSWFAEASLLCIYSRRRYIATSLCLAQLFSCNFCFLFSPLLFHVLNNFFFTPVLPLRRRLWRLKNTELFGSPITCRPLLSLTTSLWSIRVR